jgi:hypothetical protein
LSDVTSISIHPSKPLPVSDGTVHDIPHEPLLATLTSPLSLPMVDPPPPLFQKRTRTASVVVA